MSLDTDSQDPQIRKAAFDWLEEQSTRHGDVLPRQLLSQGLEWQGQRVPLVGPAGIFKPKVLPEMPLTITTAPGGPYEDAFGDDHRLLYRYRGDDPNHRDNRGLREAMRRRAPLIYLFGLIPGRYMAVWPVFVVGDDPNQLTFTVMADAQDTIADALERGAEHELTNEPVEARQRYITGTIQRRLHQRSFRERVLSAYRNRCAMCRLAHRELLDASHIIPDHERDSPQAVTNGLSLCKIHHAAFDANVVGIRPDNYQIEIRPDVLEEKDGPMLRHGLQGMHRQKLHLPTKPQAKPAREALEWRYERFRG